jgi:predicted permease
MLHALRALRSNRGITAVAILSLALGIGASTAIFTLIDAVMLKPLPINRPEELGQVAIGSGAAFGNPIWEQVRDRQDVFSGIFAYGRWFDLARGGEVHTANGQYVSGQYFETLQVGASLGRLLMPADDRRACAPVAILTHAFWRKEYSGRTDMVGKAISLDNHPFEIMGVAPPGFSGVEVGQPADLFVPLCAERIIHAEAPLLDRNYLPGWLQVIGRLKPGVTETRANARLKVLAPEIFRASLPPDWRAEDRAAYLPNTLDTEGAANGLSWTRRRYRQALAILMGIVSLVLLITCANVANLLLARGAAREREIAIRQALGCGRLRLIRQLLMESLLLAGAGAALGVIFAQWGARALAAFLDVHLDLALNLSVMSFTAGVPECCSESPPRGAGRASRRRQP